VKFRKRPAIYALIGVIGTPLIIATYQIFSGRFTGDLAAGIGVIATFAALLGGFGNKILESEEKGDLPAKENKDGKTQ